MKKFLLVVGILLLVLVIGLGVAWVNLNTLVKTAVESSGSIATKSEVKLESGQSIAAQWQGDTEGPHGGQPRGISGRLRC